MSILDAANKPKNILEMLSFDLTKFFADNDYCEIQSKDIEGVFMVEFSACSTIRTTLSAATTSTSRCQQTCAM